MTTFFAVVALVISIVGWIALFSIAGELNERISALEAWAGMVKAIAIKAHETEDYE